MGSVEKISHQFVKRPCAFFWLFLLLDLLLSVIGVSSLVARSRQLNQTSVFSTGSDYDWTIEGADPSIARDMIYDAYVKAEMPETRRLAEKNGKKSRRLSEVPSSSGERNEPAGSDYTINLLFYARSPTDGVGLFSAAMLKQMCDVENHILGHGDYGKVCLLALPEANPGGLYATDGHTNCSMPQLSAASLFYRTYDASRPRDMPSLRAAYAATAAASAAANASVALQANEAAALQLAHDARAALLLLLPHWASWSFNSSVAALGMALDALGPAVAVPSAAALAVLPALQLELGALDGLMAPYAQLSPAQVERRVLLAGWPLTGLLRAAPLLGVDDDSLVEAGTFRRRCDLLDSEYVASRSRQIFELAHGGSAETLQVR